MKNTYVLAGQRVDKSFQTSGALHVDHAVLMKLSGSQGGRLTEARGNMTQDSAREVYRSKHRQNPDQLIEASKVTVRSFVLPNFP